MKAMHVLDKLQFLWWQECIVHCWRTRQRRDWWSRYHEQQGPTASSGDSSVSSTWALLQQPNAWCKYFNLGILNVQDSFLKHASENVIYSNIFKPSWYSVTSDNFECIYSKMHWWNQSSRKCYTNTDIEHYWFCQDWKLQTAINMLF